MAEQRDDKPIALDAYEALAERYAAMVDTKAENAYWERPATLSLLPDVKGLRVLDAGCGPGEYVEWLVDHGAEVAGVDASPKMVELARRRISSRATIRRADLRRPLDFLADESFDLVLSSLVMDYVEDWLGVFREFHRLLRPAGLLVFSTEHPLSNWRLRTTQDYFATERMEWTWKGFGEPHVVMPSYRRPLQAMIQPLADAGFVVERLIEPRPTEDCKSAAPTTYEHHQRQPGFMCVRARKDS